MARTLAYRLWSRTRKEGRCLVWTGALYGYEGKKRGRMRVENKLRPVTHVSWFLSRGRWPQWPGELVCHSCDVPLCVHPKHLWIGTLTDNKQDAIKKGRVRGLNPRQRERVLKLYAAGLSGREIAKLFDVWPAAIHAFLRKDRK